MRYETENWSITDGVHIGHHHQESGQNCQDAVSIRAWESNGKSHVCGVVCDGCGGVHEDLKKIGLSGHSEVGANIIAATITRQLVTISSQTKIIKDAIDILFESVKRYVSLAVTSDVPVSVDFREEIVLTIQRFWLSTILGFYMNGDEGCIFSCGDGCYQLNGSFEQIDQNDAPTYLAYACCPDPERFNLKPEFIPKTFNIIPFNIKETRQIMIATDGFMNHNVIKMDQWQRDNPNETLSPVLHGDQWGKPGNFGLKKWMNTRFVRGYFEDDCAIVTAEKK